MNFRDINSKELLPWAIGGGKRVAVKDQGLLPGLRAGETMLYREGMRGIEKRTVDKRSKRALLASYLPSGMSAQPDGKGKVAHWFLSFHDELQDGISDSDLISMIQDSHINEFAVDKGSIGTLQILQNKPAISPLDRGMLTGNR